MKNGEIGQPCPSCGDWPGGCSGCTAPLPRATLLSSRPAWAVPTIALFFALLLGALGAGVLLHRVDDLHAAHSAQTAQLRLAQAELDQLNVRIEAMTHRDVKPPNAIDQLCRDRVEALRDGIRVLQRVGKVELEDFPGMRWRDDDLWRRSR